MKNVAGIWLPDYDTHFSDMLPKQAMVNGIATYQLKKYLKARESVRRWHLAVDVGAHVGLWSRVMAGDFKQVIAFEPLSDHRECFVRNVPMNVELFPWAVSDIDGAMLELMIGGDNSGNAHVSSSYREKGEKAQTISLDNFEWPTTIDFLKIDVEGFETKVLVGGEDTIRSHKPVIILEQKPNNAERYGFKQHDAVEVLKQWGMKEVAVMAGDHIMTW